MGGMPWKEQRIVDEREAFVRSYLREATPMAELCREYGISRKTGYKWVQRFHEGGMPALMDRSRAPCRRPHAVSEEIAEAIIALRERRPTWGSRKLRAALERKHPNVPWPASSTIAALLARHGLVPERRRRRRTPQSTQPLAVAREPNDVWCVDYKGKFRVQGRYCHPFTITDAMSRYVLCCHDTGSERALPTQQACERTFREHGLPLRIRSDNGSPFASRAVGGLSRLSVWWVKLGILPERIAPGHPEQNGRHERMHRTLKHEAVLNGSRAEVQQAAFDRWCHEFNHERPHEALGNQVPAGVYRPSLRAFPGELGDPEYPDGFDVRRVRPGGQAKYRNLQIGIGTVLKHEAIGFEPIDDDRFQLWFGPVYLGLLVDLGRGRHSFNKDLPRQ
jgi:putative transposase